MERKIFLVLMLCSFVLPLAAQELKSPKEFFQRDFVNKPVARDPAVVIERREARESPSTSGARYHHTPSAQIDQSLSPDLEPTQEIEKPGVKVSYISIILSPDDAEHFRKNFTELLALRDKYSIPVKNILVVGDAHKLDHTEAAHELYEAEEAGVIRYLPSLPEPYQAVRLSPTYVLETKEGSILAEGFANIFEHFNAQGEFIEPVTTSAVKFK